MPERRTSIWICVALIASVLALYAPTARHEFVSLDDPAYIVDNPVVSRGLTVDGVRWAFTDTGSANWHPLTWLSHMLDVELFGMEPAGHHLHGALLHGLNAALLFLALGALTGSTWRSAAVALLFAVHPLRVESVAWAAERKDLLSGLFFMATVWAYAGFARRPRPGRYLVVLVLFSLGLMAKPMLVTLPCVLLLLDYWPLRRLTGGHSASRLVLEKVPLFAVAGASALVTLVVQSGSGAVMAVGTLDPVARLGNALAAYGAYLWKSLWPVGLACFYPHPAAVGLSALGPAVAGALLLALGSWLALKLREAWAVGWLWFVGMLVPVIGLVQVGEQAWADRYAYLPTIGLYLALVWSVSQVLERAPRWRTPLIAATIAASIGYAALAAAQIGHWRDSRSLFQRALAVTQRNYVAHFGLGLALAEDGDLAAAQRHYEAAIEIMPGYAEAHNNLGAMLQHGDALAAALKHFDAAVDGRPDYVEAHYNRGVVLDGLSRPDEAAESFLRALAIDPGHQPARFGLALLRAREGALDEAARLLEQVLTARPEMTEARYQLGLVHAYRGDLAAAADDLERALREAPDRPEVHNNLGIVRARQGDLVEAIARFEDALRLDPGYGEARDNLERARQGLTRRDQLPAGSAPTR